MPVEITIRVRDGEVSMNRIYFMEDLLFEPQAHIKIWNDIVMMSEDVQKPDPSGNKAIINSKQIG